MCLAFHSTERSWILFLRLVEDRSLRAIYQIPLCVSLVFLVVQGLRASASEVLAYVIRHTEDSPEDRW